MMICPRCERIIRNGEMVRVQVLGEFVKTDLEGHFVHGHTEEWVEHISCTGDAWEEKTVKWMRRKFRWLKERLKIY